MFKRFHISTSVAAALIVAVGVGCGGDDSEPDFSATSFSECLSAKDLAPEQMETARSSERYIDALSRLGAEAARENGALEAFGNDALPGAATLYFLFFEDADSASDGRKRLGRQDRAGGGGR